MKNFHSQESGRSMVEMLGVLAIIGVLSVGGIAGYSQAMSKFKVTKTTDQIQTMVTNIRTLFSTQRTYLGVAEKSMMYSTGIFTDEICSDGATCLTPTNPFGGTITLKSIKLGADDKAFVIAYDGLPADACVRLAMQDWGDASSGLIAIVAHTGESTISNEVKGLDCSGTGTGTVTKTTCTSGELPMILTEASKGCGTSGSKSSLTWYYR